MASHVRRGSTSRKSKLLIGISSTIFVAGLAATAWSVEAIRDVIFLPGTFGKVATTPNSSSGPVDLGFSANFFGGSPYNTVYVNENGNVTFTAPNPDTDPSTFDPGADGPMIAPFFTDIEVNPDGSNAVEFGQAIVDGKQAFVVNWPSVNFSGGSGGASFQLVLTQEPDGSLGVAFNYGSVTGASGSGVLAGIIPDPDDTEVEPEIVIDPGDPLEELNDPPDGECVEGSTALVCQNNGEVPGGPEFKVADNKDDGDDEIIPGPLPDGDLPPYEPENEPVLGEDPFQPIVEVEDEQQTADAPEPATMAIFGAGLIGLGFLRRRRRAA
jgi:hypothetical protein